MKNRSILIQKTFFMPRRNNELLLAITLAMCCAGDVRSAARTSHLLICGSAQVLEGAIERHHGGDVFKTQWVWRPERSAGLPLRLMSDFAGTDECKPVDDGKEILITSSGNGLALVEHGTGNTLFYAAVRNAHSAALLPDGLIVAAASFSHGGSGDRLLLFDRKISERVLASFPLTGAHGVEWDPDRNVLWALGDRELAEIAISQTGITAFTMTLKRSFSLPVRGGHDLVLAHDNSVLFLTTSAQVFIFHPEDASFSPFEVFSGISNVKSLSINPKDGQIVYTKSERGVWWTYKLQLLRPASEVVLSEHAYKARWYVTSHSDRR